MEIAHSIPTDWGVRMQHECAQGFVGADQSGGIEHGGNDEQPERGNNQGYPYGSCKDEPAPM